MNLLFRQGRGEELARRVHGRARRQRATRATRGGRARPAPSKSQVVISWLTLFWTRVFRDDGLTGGLDCAFPSWPDPTRFQLVMGTCAEACSGAIKLTLASTDTQLCSSPMSIYSHLTLLVNALFSGFTLLGEPCTTLKTLRWRAAMTCSYSWSSSSLCGSSSCHCCSSGCCILASACKKLPVARIHVYRVRGLCKG